MRTLFALVLASLLSSLGACDPGEVGDGRSYSTFDSVRAACEPLCARDADEIDKGNCVEECVARVCGCAEASCFADCSLPPAGTDQQVDACVASLWDTVETDESGVWCVRVLVPAS